MASALPHMDGSMQDGSRGGLGAPRGRIGTRGGHGPSSGPQWGGGQSRGGARGTQGREDWSEERRIASRLIERVVRKVSMKT